MDLGKQKDCPGKYCFNWVDGGDQFTEGIQNSLKSALPHLRKVETSHCGLSLGNCIRDPSSTEEDKVDFFEPNEPNLDRDGLSADSFR